MPLVAAGLALFFRLFAADLPDKDGFELTLQGILLNALGADCCARYVRVGFCDIQGKEICLVSVDRSGKPIIIEESTPS